MAPEDGSPPEKEILNLETVMFRVYVSFSGVYEFLSKCGAKEHENSQNCWLHLRSRSFPNQLETNKNEVQ